MFLLATISLVSIFSYWLFENGSSNISLFKYLTHDIVVKVSPYICCIPRLIVSFSYANPCGLWIVNPQPSLNGSCIIFSSSICVTQKRVLEPMHHKKEHKNSTQCWNQCIINKNISSQCWNQSIIRRNIITQWWNQCTIRRNISPWCWN